MPRMYAFFLGIGVGAIVLFGASNYHIVRARDGLHCVPKQRAQLSQAYVDTRNFGPNDWATNSDLAAALTADNKQQSWRRKQPVTFKMTSTGWADDRSNSRIKPRITRFSMYRRANSLWISVLA